MVGDGTRLIFPKVIRFIALQVGLPHLDQFHRCLAISNLCVCVASVDEHLSVHPCYVIQYLQFILLLSICLFIYFESVCKSYFTIAEQEKTLQMRRLIRLYNDRKCPLA